MEWIVDRWRTTTEALTLKRVIALPIFVALVAATLKLWPSVAEFAADLGSSTLLGVPAWAVAVLSAALVLAFFLLQYATDLRKSLAPKIVLSFHEDQSGIAMVPVQRPAMNPTTNQPSVIDAQAAYVRIHVATLSRAAVRDCRAFIVSISKQSEQHLPFVPMLLHNAISLSDVSVRPGIRSHVDFLSCSSTDNRLQVAGAWPLYLRDAFKEPATYRFNLTVVAADVPSSIEVDVRWRGQWDTISAKQVRPQ